MLLSEAEIDARLAVVVKGLEGVANNKKESAAQQATVDLVAHSIKCLSTIAASLAALAAAQQSKPLV